MWLIYSIALIAIHTLCILLSPLVFLRGCGIYIVVKIYVLAIYTFTVCREDFSYIYVARLFV